MASAVLLNRRCFCAASNRLKVTEETLPPPFYPLPTRRRQASEARLANRPDFEFHSVEIAQVD
jgi:hypothetical protein